MSSEIHKNIENAPNKQDVLFNAEVINLTKEKNFNKSELNKIDNQNFWELNDGSNDDQLKTVIGICLMLGSLFLMGLYSNLF
jgi:hypothetical protein